MIRQLVACSLLILSGTAIAAQTGPTQNSRTTGVQLPLNLPDAVFRVKGGDNGHAYAYGHSKPGWEKKHAPHVPEIDGNNALLSTMLLVGLIVLSRATRRP